MVCFKTTQENNDNTVAQVIISIVPAHSSVHGLNNFSAEYLSLLRIRVYQNSQYAYQESCFWLLTLSAAKKLLYIYIDITTKLATHLNIPVDIWLILGVY